MTAHCHMANERQKEPTGSGQGKAITLLILPPKDPIFPTFTVPLLAMIISVVVVEILLEMFIFHLAITNYSKHILIDSLGSFVVLSPVFYYLLYRPFKKLDAERLESKREIQSLSRQLINERDLERQALARDLHDDLGQELAALQFGIETMSVTCDLNLDIHNTPEETRAACRQQVEKLTSLIENLGERVRSIASGLRPSLLDELGLVVALEWLIDEFRNSLDGTEIDFKANGVDCRLSPEIELGIFRICQEGLNNIYKHAQAHKVIIRLRRDGALLDLTIKDDGLGFGHAELISARFGKRGTGRQGMGLLGMRERVAALEGYLELRSEKGQGTEVHVEIPTVRKLRKGAA